MAARAERAAICTASWRPGQERKLHGLERAQQRPLAVLRSGGQCGGWTRTACRISSMVSASELSREIANSTACLSSPSSGDQVAGSGLRTVATAMVVGQGNGHRQRSETTAGRQRCRALLTCRLHCLPGCRTAPAASVGPPRGQPPVGRGASRARAGYPTWSGRAVRTGLAAGRACVSLQQQWGLSIEL